MTLLNSADPHVRVRQAKFVLMKESGSVPCCNPLGSGYGLVSTIGGEKNTHKQTFTGLSRDSGGGILFVFFVSLRNDTKKHTHTNKILAPTQSWDNPANLFMFMTLCFSLPEQCCVSQNLSPNLHLRSNSRQLLACFFVFLYQLTMAKPSTPNMTGRRFHRTMEMIPARPW